MISQPSFLLGASNGTGGAWIGYVLALLSGLLDAFSFICSRKSADVPPLFIMLGTQVVSAAVLIGMGSIPSIFEDYSLAVLVTSPWKAVFVTVVGCALAILCTAACVIGSVLCPAAVSTTVYTSANMTSGYVAQLLLSNATPSPLTLSGSSLMLLAVIIMVFFRTPAESVGNTLDDRVPASDNLAKEDDDDDESIASFIASEFALSSPHDNSIRKRRTEQETPQETWCNEVPPIVVGS